MDVKFYPSDDIVSIVAGKQNSEGLEALSYDQGVAVGYAEEGSEDVVYVEILWISDRLKQGYDAETDTLTIGPDPVRDFRVVESGDIVSYRHWYEYGDGDGEWEAMKLEFRNAARHFAEVFAALPSPPDEG